MTEKTRRGIDFELPLWARVVEESKKNRRSMTAEVIVLVSEALDARKKNEPRRNSK